MATVKEDQSNRRQPGWEPLAGELARAAQRCRDSLQTTPGSLARFSALRKSVTQGHGCVPDKAVLLDFAAQCAACAVFGLELLRHLAAGERAAIRTLTDAHPLCQEVLTAANEASWQPLWEVIKKVGRGLPIDDTDSLLSVADLLGDFFERFLEHYDRRQRRRHGVFFTPRPLAEYVVEEVERTLRGEFHLADGLADTTTWSDVAQQWPRLELPDGIDPQAAFVHLLDPAAGSGAFLRAVVQRVYRTLSEMWQANGVSPATQAQLWNKYVRRHLLPRLAGAELLPAALLLAHFQLGAVLAHTGFRAGQGDRLRLELADSLQPPSGAAPRQSSLPTVVIGNPPFSGVSQHTSAWLDGLLKGLGPGESSYYHVDGQPLNERKVWLQDDYVKFFRYAQWQIQQADAGLIAFVSNHGYLDNPTFRGMRNSLLNTFSHIRLLDLHGNVKKGEGRGGGDQCVFPAEQGVAVGIFARPPQQAESTSAIVHFGRLRGTQVSKFQHLAGVHSLATSRLNPAPPLYLLRPRDSQHDDEYQRGHRLCDIMPVGCTAAVTARDGFVVAFSPGELIERMELFRNLQVSDDEIRRRFFGNTRSQKYPPGDTRGWKLSQARRRAAEDSQWQQRIVGCQYRPFDRRFIYWAGWMIDWPRDDVMRHLDGENLALVARRQMLPGRPCNYFWVADGIVIDGLIRSDNRGSESFFPLALQVAGGERCKSNFSREFVQLLRQQCQLQLRHDVDVDGECGTTLLPDELLHYIYALFHSTQYRRRYAEQLRLDFPRVFLPASVALFRDLSQLGSCLVENHLLRGTVGQDNLPRLRGGDARIAAGFPKFASGRLAVNPQAYFSPVPDGCWQFCVGGHQVLRKWLRDRRGRELSAGDVSHYGRMVVSIRSTLRIVEQIDSAINAAGGFPDAFC